MNLDPSALSLRAAGCCLIIDAARPVPHVLHWGADIGSADGATLTALNATSVPAVLNNAPDMARLFSVWPTERDGWSGTAAQEGNAAGGATTPRPLLVDVSSSVDSEGGGIISLSFVDSVCALRSQLTYRMDRFGVVSVDCQMTRDAGLGLPDHVPPYTLDAWRALMPIPARAVELMDFTGKWCRERAPQRTPLTFGSHVRRARRGKPGHDSPYLMALGTLSFGFRHGEVWATHLAWSGDGEYLAERLPESAGAFASVLGAGESLASGEVRLADGQAYTAPTVVFVWSDQGLDGLADRLHRRLRARPSHPRSPRPVTLNTWEAVYFDQDLTRLTPLVQRAAQVGVERVVLDDGWFLGRRDDRAGLGDWQVDPAVWPNGLGPFADLVHGYGMEFGLWVEPEMVNLDSDLARVHPDWVLGPREGLGPSSRHQYVLDLANPGAYTYVYERLCAAIGDHSVDALKWDHNRDLLEAVGRRGDQDRPMVHQQTLALYRLLDDLRAQFPGLEIETCSGGGGRVDLGILDRTDRLWASDCNDPVERLEIERWTRLLVPPELIGSHYGAARSHTTGRTTDSSLRLIVSLLGHAGIERDLADADQAELDLLTRWIGLHKRLRPLLHAGTWVNAELADEALALFGVVATDRRQALYVWAPRHTSFAGQAGRVQFPGLDPTLTYRVRVLDDLGLPSCHEVASPPWMATCLGEGVDIPGVLLTTVGLPLPNLDPQQAMLIQVRAVTVPPQTSY
ncbi:MAG: alpha-galactosidase [Propionibacteriaceae bacterium]|nr:alpha-galactosidase [Propionibacteriaceae bacterium]